MSDIANKTKLDLIKELTKKHGITAYEIGENIPYSSVAVHNILSGKSTKPRERTLNSILAYLESKLVGRSIPGHENFVEEDIKEDKYMNATSYRTIINL